MDKSLSHEFIEVMSKMRKLTGKYHAGGCLHPGEFMMLSAINQFSEELKKNNIDQPGVKVGDLSEVIHSSKSATSKMLKTIEDKGYIERVVDSTDRRIVYVTLSTKGKEIIHHAISAMKYFADCTIEKLGEEDTRDLIRLLNKFYQAMSDVISENNMDHKEDK